MKKRVSKFTITAVIFLFSVTALSYSKNDPQKTNTINQDGITYVVNLDLSDAGSLCYAYIVVIRDENGYAVGSYRTFMEGINTYVFHEDGPVTGTRSAHFERVDYSCCNQCSNLYYVQSDYKKGSFRDGKAYLFELKLSDVPDNN